MNFMSEAKTFYPLDFNKKNRKIRSSLSFSFCLLDEDKILISDEIKKIQDIYSRSNQIPYDGKELLISPTTIPTDKQICLLQMIFDLEVLYNKSKDIFLNELKSTGVINPEIFVYAYLRPKLNSQSGEKFWLSDEEKSLLFKKS